MYISLCVIVALQLACVCGVCVCVCLSVCLIANKDCSFVHTVKPVNSNPAK
jgi:hypothetical protein